MRPLVLFGDLSPQEFAEFLNYAQDKLLVRVEPDEEKGLLVYLGAEFYPPAPPEAPPEPETEVEVEEPQPYVKGQPSMVPEPEPKPQRGRRRKDTAGATPSKQRKPRQPRTTRTRPRKTGPMV